MRTDEQRDSPHAASAPRASNAAPDPSRRRPPLREAALLIVYQARLLNWWLFALMALGFVGAGALVLLSLRIGGPQGVSQATALSQFALESGSGLIAAMLASSLVVSDPLLEVTMATRAGMCSVVAIRYALTFFALLLCSAIFLGWTLDAGIRYARQQSPLYLLLVWLAPALVMGMLGLLASLAVRNTALGMVIAVLPLAGALFLHGYLLPIQASHPYLIPYTSWAADASDWWINRLTLLGAALAFGVGNWLLLRREERLLGALD